MNSIQMEAVIEQISNILRSQLLAEIAELPKTETANPQTVEMLTIKECTECISGLSEHTVRQLVLQGKIPSVRAGTGKRGKILVSKSALLAFFNHKDYRQAVYSAILHQNNLINLRVSENGIINQINISRENPPKNAR